MKSNPKYAEPGDLIRPKKNYNVNMWGDVINHSDGRWSMNGYTVLYDYMISPGIVIYVAGQMNSALLVWISKKEKLVWVWRNSIVIVQKGIE